MKEKLEENRSVLVKAWGVVCLNLIAGSGARNYFIDWRVVVVTCHVSPSLCHGHNHRPEFIFIEFQISFLI